jgi:RNA polymerase sigma-70 factor (ECF subfamily)
MDATRSYDCVLRAWNAHEAELRTHLAWRLGDAAAADDLLQDVFVKAMRAGRDFCVLDNPRAWLYQVARNALVDEVRRHRPHEPLPDDLPWEPAESPPPVDGLADCLARVLGQLSPADADILRRCDLEGQTQSGYARAHDLSLPGAKSRLQRARARLHEQLTQRCGVRLDDQGVCCHAAAPPV